MGEGVFHRGGRKGGSQGWGKGVFNRDGRRGVS